MSYMHIVLLRSSTLAVFLVAGLAPGILAAPAGDAATILADCEKSLNKKLEDCCEDFGERADRGVKNIDKELKAGKCTTAKRKRDTSLNLISSDMDKCVPKLAELREKCGPDPDMTLDDPEGFADAEEKVSELLKSVAEKLNDCYDTERKRIEDAYTTGAADAGCDDESGGAD